jgi:hypothetical protein
MVNKPRLQHPDLADSNLTAEEKQRERVRRWLANEKLDPGRALELRLRNNQNKREQRRRKRELESNGQVAGDTNTAEGTDRPPKRRRTGTSQTPSGSAGPSNTTQTPSTETPSGPEQPTLPPTTESHIPIDPILLNEEASHHAPTPDADLSSKETSTVTRVLCDVEVMTEPPHVQCDVEVMTEALNVQSPPSPTLSALTDLDSKDLATSIIGKQVHELSETVQWSDGSITVLPCIMKNGDNIIQDDADAVSFFASLPESTPQTSKHVVHLNYSDWTNKSRQLCDEISTALRSSKAVVIRQVSSPNLENLDLDYLEDRGMSDLMRVVVHGESIHIFNFLKFLNTVPDAEERSRNFTYPHQHATLHQFMENIEDPNKIQCILDVPYAQSGLPLSLRCVTNYSTNLLALTGLSLALWTMVSSMPGIKPPLTTPSTKQSTRTTLRYARGLYSTDPRIGPIPITTLMVVPRLSESKPARRNGAFLSRSTKTRLLGPTLPIWH